MLVLLVLLVVLVLLVLLVLLVVFVLLVLLVLLVVLILLVLLVLLVVLILLIFQSLDFFLQYVDEVVDFIYVMLRDRQRWSCRKGVLVGDDVFFELPDDAF